MSVAPLSDRLPDLDLENFNTDDEVELLRSVCRDSFHAFVGYFWSAINFAPMVDNWHIGYLCDNVETTVRRVAAGEPRLADEIYNVPPGSTKSTIFSIMLPAWAWSNWPWMRFICASHTHDLVLELSRKSRYVIQSPLYRLLFPEVIFQSDQNNKGHFANTLGGTRFCCTVGGKSPMGMHGHVICVDDPIDPEKALTDAGILSANNFMTETIPSRRIEQSIAVMLLIMQRLAQNDPTGHLLKKSPKRFRHYCLPAEVTDKINPPELRERYVDGLLDPRRLPRVVLDEKKETMTEYSYASQYLETPIPLGGGLNKIAQIRMMAQTPPDSEFERILRFWDKAATPDGGCRTAGAKLGRKRIGTTPGIPGSFGRSAIPPRPIYDWYILHVATGQWGTDEREARIRQTAEVDGRHCHIGLEQEPGSGGKHSAEFTISGLAGYKIIAEPATGDKTERHRPFSSQLNSGRVVMIVGDWNARVLDELEFFPFSTYKDIADALSGAFNLLTGPKLVVGGIGGSNAIR